MTRYEVFMKILEMGSFTRAAQELNYTQSAISQMVHTLEEELSTTLLLRSKSGVQLTADGEEYLPYLRAVCHTHRELERKRQQMQGLQSGVIRIGTFTSVSRGWLPQWMKAFKMRYPSVRFVLQQGEYTNIGQWIREGSVDFGFLNPDAVSGLETAPLYQDAMQALLPPGHPLARKEQVTLEELCAEPYILLDEGELSVPLNSFRQRGLQPNVQYKVVDDYTIMSMVEQGLGVSILYNLVLDKEGHGFVTRPVYPPVKRTIALAWKHKKALPIASRYFMDFILEQFEKTQNLTEVLDSLHENHRRSPKIML